jgi:hypothetical protein
MEMHKLMSKTNTSTFMPLKYFQVILVISNWCLLEEKPKTEIRRMSSIEETTDSLMFVSSI